MNLRIISGTAFLLGAALLGGISSGSAAERPVSAVDMDSTKVGIERLIGLKATTAEGKKAGEIEDILVDRRTGSAAFAIVRNSSWFEQERFAVPFERLAFKALPIAQDASQSEFSEWFARCSFVIDDSSAGMAALIGLGAEADGLTAIAGGPQRYIGIRDIAKMKIAVGQGEYRKVKDVIVDVANGFQVWAELEEGEGARFRVPLELVGAPGD